MIQEEYNKQYLEKVLLILTVRQNCKPNLSIINYSAFISKHLYFMFQFLNDDNSPNKKTINLINIYKTEENRANNYQDTTKISSKKIIVKKYND